MDLILITRATSAAPKEDRLPKTARSLVTSSINYLSDCAKGIPKSARERAPLTPDYKYVWWELFVAGCACLESEGPTDARIATRRATAEDLRREIVADASNQREELQIRNARNQAALLRCTIARFFSSVFPLSRPARVLEVSTPLASSRTSLT